MFVVLWADKGKHAETIHLILGPRGSVVSCVTYKREIAGSISSWAELCSDVALLGKALCPHVHSRPRGKWVPGRRVKACMLEYSSVRRKWQPDCRPMLPRELSWLMNETVLWPEGNGVKSGEQGFALDTYQTVNLHLHLYKTQIHQYRHTELSAVLFSNKFTGSEMVFWISNRIYRL